MPGAALRPLSGRRRYYVEIMGRRRFRIQQAWEQDGYRIARPRYFTDGAPASSDEEHALAQQTSSVESLADQWLQRLRCCSPSHILPATILHLSCPQKVCLAMHSLLLGPSARHGTSDMGHMLTYLSGALVLLQDFIAHSNTICIFNCCCACRAMSLSSARDRGILQLLSAASDKPSARSSTSVKPSHAEAMSFWAACILPLDSSRRQSLMEITSTPERLHTLQGLLQAHNDHGCGIQ